MHFVWIEKPGTAELGVAGEFLRHADGPGLVSTEGRRFALDRDVPLLRLNQHLGGSRCARSNPFAIENPSCALSLEQVHLPSPASMPMVSVSAMPELVKTIKPYR